VKLKLIILVLTILLVPIAIAHLDAGEDKVVDGYLVDFGYLPDTPTAGDKIQIVFNLLNSSTKEVLEPTSVWVRISNSDTVLFAGTFYPEEGSVAFTYAVFKAGDYEVDARFKAGSEVLVQTSFDLQVKDRSLEVPEKKEVQEEVQEEKTELENRILNKNTVIFVLIVLLLISLSLVHMYRNKSKK